MPEPVSAGLKTEIVREAALALFKRGLCSAGVAAKLLGMSLVEFLDLLKKEGVTYSPEAADASEADLESLDWMDRQRRSR
jgi:predicted HTH domain antitoxin